MSRHFLQFMNGTAFFRSLSLKIRGLFSGSTPIRMHRVWRVTFIVFALGNIIVLFLSGLFFLDLRRYDLAEKTKETLPTRAVTIDRAILTEAVTQFELRAMELKRLMERAPRLIDPSI